jgi:Pyruvate/2-oxoacid:ferredoxin oxidoreductase gamma subunit
MMLNEKPKKLTAKQQKAANDARINKAVAGFVIPMMSIPKMAKALEAAIAAGRSDEELKAVVAAFPGVSPSI